MSINKFQEKVFRTGCGSAVLYVCAAVFFGGMFYLGCGIGSGAKGPGDPNSRLVALEVGDNPVYYDQFNQNVQQMRDNRRNQSPHPESPDSITPMDEAEIEGGMLNSYVTTLGAVYLDEKAGVKFTDQQISSIYEKNLENEINTDKTDLIAKGKLKPDAKEKDIDAALKAAGKRSATERRTSLKNDLAKALKDEKNRSGLQEEVARQILLETITNSIKPSDAELKATYDSFTFKRILFSAHPGSTVDSQIAKAQADLKAGTTFEQAIDRYSSEPPLKGKKLSDNTTDMGAAQLNSMPQYAPLKSLKVGQVSDPIETPMGKAIYKLEGTKNLAPPDFPTNKAKYLKDYATQKAQTEIDKELKDFAKSDKVVWKMNGLKALFDWYQARQDFMLPPAQLATKMATVVDEAKKAMAASQTDSRAAALAWYASFDTIWTAPGADKVKLRGDKIELLKAITSLEPAFSLKIELVDLLIDSNATDEAIEGLKAAASSNFLYDLEGQQDWQQVQARIVKLKAANKLPAAAEKDLQKIQQEWIKENDVAATEKAEMKKQEEQAKKEAAANAAKQKAETDKQKAEAAKGAKGAKPATGTTATATVPSTAPGAPPVIKATINPPKPATTGTTPPPAKKQ